SPLGFSQMAVPPIMEVCPPPPGLEAEYSALLTADCRHFLHELISTFDEEVDQVLQFRVHRKAELDLSGGLPSFPESTAHFWRDPAWRVLPVPPRLRRRHVDVDDLAPCDTQRFIKGLQSPAQGLQVHHVGIRASVIKGIHNVVQVVHNRIPNVPCVSRAPVLMLCPRAWNMVEHNMPVEGKEAPGPLFDFGLLMFHCGQKLLEQQSGPFFYLSKVKKLKLFHERFVLQSPACYVRRSGAAGTGSVVLVLDRPTDCTQHSPRLYFLLSHASCCQSRPSLGEGSLHTVVLPKISSSPTGFLEFFLAGCEGLRRWLLHFVSLLASHFFYRGQVEDSATAEISGSQVSSALNRLLYTHEKLVMTSETEGWAPPLRLSLYRSKQMLHTAAGMLLEVVLKRYFPEFISSYLNQEHTFLSVHGGAQTDGRAEGRMEDSEAQPSKL
uniref:malate synthase n=1 Tax=Salarias fasciatus TaxID=181472 RepID=A0A672GEL0_SALFA